MRIRAIFSDLDRTILDNSNNLSRENLQALQKLGGNDIFRIVATGRSLFSCKKVINSKWPLDYLIFSTGCGIMDWRRGEIIRANHLDGSRAEQAIRILKEFRIDFMVQAPIPDNHFFYYWAHQSENPDFWKRIEIYRDFAQLLPEKLDWENVSQLIAIIPLTQKDLLNQIISRFPFLQVILTTSPLDHETLWLELFPPEVSKGKAAAWLSEYLGVKREETAGIGNDYNDLDLLDWTRCSYVVNNAPVLLKERFSILADNERHGFARFVEICLKHNRQNIL
ncbi:MAG: HAD family phosphatase [Candidatus Cloacimonetes bacterium]|nr:HAD family phosphatase [Candidatus Cloacimonadota bacterium]